jgi:hypothetical protein
VRETFLTFEPRAPRTRLRRSERHNFRLPSETAATVVDRQSRVGRYELCSWRVIISQFPLSLGRVLSESPSTCFCPQWKQSSQRLAARYDSTYYRHFFRFASVLLSIAGSIPTDRSGHLAFLIESRSRPYLEGFVEIGRYSWIGAIPPAEQQLTPLIKRSH